MTTFVLVPGAWHTAASWAPVARRLRGAARASADGSVPVPDTDLLRTVFLPGTSTDLQQLVGDLLVPTPGAYFLEPAPGPTRPGAHESLFTHPGPLAETLLDLAG